jgi:hypothetical protein
VGVGEGLWRMGGLGAPESEEEAAVFYNGVLGRRSLSQFESRPHVFASNLRFHPSSIEGGGGGEAVSIDEGGAAGAGAACI